MLGVNLKQVEHFATLKKVGRTLVQIKEEISRLKPPKKMVKLPHDVRGLLVDFQLALHNSEVQLRTYEKELREGHSGLTQRITEDDINDIGIRQQHLIENLSAAVALLSYVKIQAEESLDTMEELDKLRTVLTEFNKKQESMIERGDHVLPWENKDFSAEEAVRMQQYRMQKGSSAHSISSNEDAFKLFLRLVDHTHKLYLFAY